MIILNGGTMSRAGQLPSASDLINSEQIINAYYSLEPSASDPAQKVVFGTSGHRGAAEKTSFNQAHIVAITAAIVEYRKNQGFGGTILVGFDTHLLSLPAFKSCLEVLAAAEVDFSIDTHIREDLIELALQGEAPEGCAIWTPTPAASHAILRANADKTNNLELSDGIIITPSHNPPTDGGIKYNPPHGGPAGSEATSWIANRANELLENWQSIPRLGFDEALLKAKRVDFRDNYVQDLANVIDMSAIKQAGVRICADSLGGASIDYWSEIAKVYGLQLTVANPKVDPTFRFITLDWDEKIRMDCSSPNSMAGTVEKANASDEFDLYTGNDADSDRHGIVARNSTTGTFELMNPNHFLATAISYLFGEGRPNWPSSLGIGKTLVSSSLIDRVAEGLHKRLVEVPVGFKWFVDGLINGSIGFGGEESAGASFLRRDGRVWTTDKDGIILALLAAEIMAKTGKSPLAVHRELVDTYGESWYERIDAPANLEQKAKLASLSPDQVTASELAGEEITSKLTTASGNGASIGGLKVTTKNAWFAARPSGTEDVYKIYSESFISAEHLKEVQQSAKSVVDSVLGGS